MYIYRYMYIYCTYIYRYIHAYFYIFIVKYIHTYKLTYSLPVLASKRCGCVTSGAALLWLCDKRCCFESCCRCCSFCFRCVIIESKLRSLTG